MLQSGDFVLIVIGNDDVADGQVCKVLAPDEAESFHRYQLDEWVPVVCWTGYLVWTTQDNLIEITGDRARLEHLFRLGLARTGTDTLSF